MSYNLYVTRKKDWAEKPTGPNQKISKAEFKKFAMAHPSMEVFDRRDLARLVAIFHVEEYAPEGYDVWSIEWKDGVVMTDMRAVPREVVAVLLELAKVLKAKVQGEEGEIYTARSLSDFPTIPEFIAQAAAVQARKEVSRKKKLRWRIFRRTVLIFFLLCIPPLGWMAAGMCLYAWYKQSGQQRQK